MKYLIFCGLACAMTLFGGEYTPRDFSYLEKKVEGLDSQLLNMHFKLYQGYVKNTNGLIEELKEMGEKRQDRTAAYGALKRRFGWEFDGMRLHELYFSNLGGNGESLDPKSQLYKKLVEEFGNYQTFAQEFKATGLIRGIGWVILYKDPQDDHLRIVWINEHDLGHLAGGEPILVMDVWEHAYITEFGLDRAGYIDVFMKNINWKEVERRL